MIYRFEKNREKYPEKELPASNQEFIVPAEKPKGNTFKNPHGCLRGKAGCAGSPIRVLDWKGKRLFVCPCQFDTFSPPKKVRDLAQAEGLL